MLRLVIIYGPPAVGKLTVARLLAARTGWRLFDNHLTVDLALSLFDFGTQGFVALRESIWTAAFDAVLAAGEADVIFTFNPEPSVASAFIPELVSRFLANGADVTLVSLTADRGTLESRIDASSRRDKGKLTDPALFARLMDDGVFDVGSMPTSDLTLDTGMSNADATAARIAEYLNA